jgi:transglutaminase-like putative cysteine protease
MADRTTGYLLAVDPADGSVQSAFHVADRLTGVTCDGEYLWTCSELVDAIFRIDPASGEILDRLAAPGSAPAGLAWDGEALWCVDRETETLFRLSPEDGSVISELSYIATAEDAIFDAPRSFRGLMWNSGYLYLVDSARRRIFQIDPKTGFVTSQIDTPTGYPRGIAADGERFWYTDRYLGLHELEVKIPPGVPYVLSNPIEWQIRYFLTRRNEGGETAKNLRIYLGVPESLEHQEVLSASYSPEPSAYMEDVFGQKIAEFLSPRVPPGSEVTIHAEFVVRLWHINYTIDPDEVGTLSDIPFSVSRLYLVDGDKYDIYSPVVRSSLVEAIGDETNPYLMAVAIHDYVAERITYGSGPDGWAAAPLVLEAGEGSCSESTFCVVALARAAGLPARYQGGTAPRADGVDTDGHRWAEIYIPGYGWVPFDATRDDEDDEARHWYVASRPVMLTVVRGGGTDQYLYHTYLDWGKWSGSGVSMDRNWRYEWDELE